MTAISALIRVITPLMLAIHVSTARLIRAWEAGTASQLSRWPSARRVLRIEAVYWALALLARTLWRGPGWKFAVAVLAAVHLASWLANKLHPAAAGMGQPGRTLAPKVKQAAVAFDLVEVVVFCAVGWMALQYALSAAV